jgi:hypothetical protein
VRYWWGDQGVCRVEDHQAILFRHGDAFEDHGSSVLDADDLAASGEHGGDRTPAVGYNDLHRRDTVAWGDDDAMDLTADTDRPARHDLIEVGDSETLAPLHQAGPFELVDGGPQSLAQGLHSHAVHGSGRLGALTLGIPRRAPTSPR